MINLAVIFLQNLVFRPTSHILVIPCRYHKIPPVWSHIHIDKSSHLWQISQDKKQISRHWINSLWPYDHWAYMCQWNGATFKQVMAHQQGGLFQINTYVSSIGSYTKLFTENFDQILRLLKWNCSWNYCAWHYYHLYYEVKGQSSMGLQIDNNVTGGKTFNTDWDIFLHIAVETI